MRPSRPDLRRAGVAGPLALLAGALLPLAFAPFDLYPLAVLAPAVLFGLWQRASPRRAALLGWLFGLGQFGVGVSWVFVAAYQFGNTGAPVAGLLTAVFVAVLALYPALVGYLGRRLAPAIGDGGALLLVWPALWSLGEWLRGWFLSGFPWLALGYSQIDTPLAGLAPLGGVYLLSWVLALSAGALVYLVRCARAGGAGRSGRAGAAATLVLGLWLVGVALAGTEWTRPHGAALEVSLVQGNLPQETKWDPAAIEARLNRYADLTLERLGRSDLVVWPENAVTVFYHQLEADYFGPLARMAAEAGTDVILGVPVLAEDGERYFTGMMHLGAEPRFYFKRHLVPFGEYVPLESLLRGLIGFFDLPMSRFLPGPPGQGPLPAAGQRAAVSICYEDAFGSEVAAALQGATLLVNGSNNAWYGDSLAPHQHLQISRMRALETGRPLLRATTNGISALVDPRGALVATSPQFETHVLTGRVQPMSGTTPFAEWRNGPVLVLLGLLLAVGLWRARR